MAASTASQGAARIAPSAFVAIPSPAPGSVDPVRAAREVFEAPDFWWKRIAPGPSTESSWLRALLKPILDALARAWNAVWRLIARIFRFLFDQTFGESSGGSVIVWCIAGAVLAWAIWKLTPLIRGWLGRGSPSVAPAGFAAQALPAAADLRAEAGQALREGRYDEAIRLALLALIAALEKRGLLRYDATRTNREYRAELRPHPQVAARFAQLALVYEGVWYGREPADHEQAEESIRLCDLSIDGEAPSPG